MVISEYVFEGLYFFTILVVKNPCDYVFDLDTVNILMRQYILDLARLLVEYQELAFMITFKLSDQLVPHGQRSSDVRRVWQHLQSGA